MTDFVTTSVITARVNHLNHQGVDVTTSVYISGPITGHRLDNRPAFDTAADKLRGMGLSVIVPHDLHEVERTWEEYLRIDLAAMLTRCWAVLALDGWETSRGAALEVDVARAVGIPVLHDVDSVVLLLLAERGRQLDVAAVRYTQYGLEAMDLV